MFTDSLLLLHFQLKHINQLHIGSVIYFILIYFGHAFRNYKYIACYVKKIYSYLTKNKIIDIIIQLSSPSRWYKVQTILNTIEVHRRWRWINEWIIYGFRNKNYNKQNQTNTNFLTYLSEKMTFPGKPWFFNMFLNVLIVLIKVLLFSCFVFILSMVSCSAILLLLGVANWRNRSWI